MLFCTYFFGGSFRVTLVVDWWFLPKILGPWWGPTKAIYRSVNTDRIIILFAGGGDTWTQFSVIKVVWTFCTERRWGAKNLIFWSCKLVVQINLYGEFFVGLQQHRKWIWGGDSIWRWWGHPTTIYHNRNYLHLLPSVAVGSQKVKKSLEHSTSARGVVQALVELERGDQELSNKKKFIKIGPLLRN